MQNLNIAAVIKNHFVRGGMMSNLTKTVMAVTLIGCLLIGAFLDWSTIVTGIFAVVVSIIATIIAEELEKAINQKRNKKHVQKMQRDQSFEQDKELQSLMKKGAKTDKLVEAGASILCSYSDANHPFISITSHGGVSAFNFIHPDNLHLEIRSEEREEFHSERVNSKASATGRAIVGGAVAGAAGAVIGAVSANEANKNRRPVTITHKDTIKYKKLCLGGEAYLCYCVAKHACKRFGEPKYNSGDFNVEENQSYYVITGPFAAAESAGQKQGIQYYYDYLSRIISGTVK